MVAGATDAPNQAVKRVKNPVAPNPWPVNTKDNKSVSPRAIPASKGGQNPCGEHCIRCNSFLLHHDGKDKRTLFLIYVPSFHQTSLIMYIICSYLRYGNEFMRIFLVRLSNVISCHA